MRAVVTKAEMKTDQSEDEVSLSLLNDLQLLQSLILQNTSVLVSSTSFSRQMDSESVANESLAFNRLNATAFSSISL